MIRQIFEYIKCTQLNLIDFLKHFFLHKVYFLKYSLSILKSINLIYIYLLKIAFINIILKYYFIISYFHILYVEFSLY